MAIENTYSGAIAKTRNQFDEFVRNAVGAPAASLARPGTELIYKRPGADYPDGSLGFGNKTPSWWARRQNRKRTREELAKLINESFGSEFASVRRGLFEESIGHRLLRDCAPQGLFSITKIDEEALKAIARRVHVLRQEMAKGDGSLRQRTYRDRLRTFVLSPNDLRMIYARADNQAHRDSSQPVAAREADTLLEADHPAEERRGAVENLAARPSAPSATSLEQSISAVQRPSGRLPESQASRNQSAPSRHAAPNALNESDGLRAGSEQVDARSVGSQQAPLKPVAIDKGRLHEAAELVRLAGNGQARERRLLEEIAGTGGDPYRQFAIYKTKLEQRIFRDYVDGLQWLLRAAAQNHPEALAELEYIRRHGAPEIRFTLSEIFRHGLDPVDADISAAKNWYEGPDLPAFREPLSQLGHIFDRDVLFGRTSGRQVQRNPEIAADYFLRHVYQIDPNGNTVTPTQLVNLEIIAEHGSPRIQYMRALASEWMAKKCARNRAREGRWCAQHEREARYWFGVAAKNGYTEKNYLEDLALETASEPFNDSGTELEENRRELILYLMARARTSDGENARMELLEYKTYGPADFQFHISQLYRQAANGVSKDLDESCDFLIASFKRGCRQASKEISRLSRENDPHLNFALYRYNVDNGGGNSQSTLSFLLRAVAQGHDRAQEKLLDIAKNGPPALQFEIAELYRTGADGIEQNIDEAVKYCRSAAFSGHAAAQYQYGICLKERSGANQGHNEAIQWFVRAARTGHAAAAAEIEIFKRAASPETQFALGEAYYQLPDRTSNDLKSAFRAFQSAALHGHAGAQYRLGCMYRDGQTQRIYTVQADLQAAIWLFRAAHQHNGEATRAIDDIKKNGTLPLRFALSELFANGFENTPSNFAAAGTFNTGNDQPEVAEILYRLGRLYQDGHLGLAQLGVNDLDVDTRQATEYYLRAIEQGDQGRALQRLRLIAVRGDGPVPLYHEIGRIYEEGRGATEADLVQAREWYQRAANENYAEAQYRLALCLLKGDAPNVPQAMLWLARAARGFNRDAALHLDRIAKRGPVAQQLALAHAYEQGVEMPRAEQNNENGPAIQQDIDEAIAQSRRAYDQRQAAEWYRRAALRGDADAQYHYALSFHDGGAGGRDDAKYPLWLSRAAEHGHADAQFAISLFFQEARQGSDRADVAFARWLALAAAQGHEAAADLMVTQNIEAPQSNSNLDLDPPDWWPIATTLINDQLNHLTALSILEPRRRLNLSNDDAAAHADGLTNDDENAGGQEEAAERAVMMLLDAYEALRDRGAFDPDKHLADFEHARQALDQQVRFLAQLQENTEADGGSNDSATASIAKRRQGLSELKETLDESHQILTAIQSCRQNHRSYAEDMLKPMAVERGLLPGV